MQWAARCSLSGRAFVSSAEQQGLESFCHGRPRKSFDRHLSTGMSELFSADWIGQQFEYRIGEGFGAIPYQEILTIAGTQATDTDRSGNHRASHRPSL